jgi:hypothetical protein
MRKKFTDRFIKSLRAAPSGKRIEYWDTIVHGLGVRVTDRGVKSYVMYRRWPGSTAPTRRKIHSEHATDLSLDLARKIARQWLELLAQGIDPKTKELDEKNAKQREAQVTFGAVFEDWLRDDVSRMAKCDEIKRAIRWEFRDWFGRPITGIQTIEVRNIITPDEAAARLQERGLPVPPTLLQLTSVAHALNDLREDGETDDLDNRHFNEETGDSD